MANHDLLVLNTESSEMYNEALNEFIKEKTEHYKVSGEDIYDDMYGFSSGFWAATKILTGFGAEWDR
jgi:hypothetical protein